MTPADPDRERRQRAAVLEEARSWIGTRWHHGARVKGAGVDCGQLLIAVYQAGGVVGALSPEPYPQDWALHRGEERFLQEVERYALRLPEAEIPQPADLLLFRYGRCLSHAAIVEAWPIVIHAYLNEGRVVRDDLVRNSELAARYAGAWSPWRKHG